MNFPNRVKKRLGRAPPKKLLEIQIETKWSLEIIRDGAKGVIESSDIKTDDFETADIILHSKQDDTKVYFILRNCAVEQGLFDLRFSTKERPIYNEEVEP